MSHGSTVDINVKRPESMPRRTLAALMRFNHRINEWIMGVSTIAILGAALILTLSVVTRYFLKVSTDWQDEASVFLLVGSIFMCGAYVRQPIVRTGRMVAEILIDIIEHPNPQPRRLVLPTELVIRSSC